MAEMADFIVRFYGLSEEGAREVIAEMRSLESLQILAGGYRVARAVPVSTPPE